MKKWFVVAGLIILVVGPLSFVFAAKPSQPVCPITSATNVVVYGETGFGGVGDLSKSWIGKFLSWWKTQDSGVNYVFLDAADVKADCILANYPQVKLYIQPGGNAYYQQNKLDVAGKSNILDYVNNRNGTYLGICAGFFYASNDYWWQGQYYNWPNLLMKFPTTEGSITQIADYDANPGYAMTPLSNGFNAIYYGGATRGLQYTPNEYPGIMRASFAALPNNIPAIIQNGKMLLTSVHLEAYENDGITGLSTEQRVENYKLLANLINEAAGTSFNVPAYTNPPQCSDGIDNDGNGLTDLADNGCSSSSDLYEITTACNDGSDNDSDGLTDYSADPGCGSSEDNDEYNAPAPVYIFYDGFEFGIGGWTLQTAGGANPWNTKSPGYAGTYSASVTPMSTTTPAASVEKAVSTVGYSIVALEYARKLIGLDAADEYRAKWFDGATWSILEQTGSNSANDGGYVVKTFALPSGAGNNPSFKIRFECTAGAVSESCNVDEVKVSGQ